MHLAASAGHLEVVKRLVATAELLAKDGAQVSAMDCERATPLHDAAAAGHTKIVEFLIYNEAEVDAVDSTRQV